MAEGRKRPAYRAGLSLTKALVPEYRREFAYRSGNALAKSIPGRPQQWFDEDERGQVLQPRAGIKVSQAQQLMEIEMKTLSAIAVSLVLATGAALAQGSGGSGSGGTDTGPGGTNTGKDAAAMNPTVEQCQKGWDSSMRMTQAEFKAACEK